MKTSKMKHRFAFDNKVEFNAHHRCLGRNMLLLIVIKDVGVVYSLLVYPVQQPVFLYLST